ncbi:MAG TPA: cyclic nucleotide-binding domain-containing protein [Polyangiaceae bacterium]
MSDVRSRRISRELFLAAFGGSLRSVEPWVTDRLTAMLEEEECAPGERIYSEGEAPDHFYMLRQGRLELVRSDRPVEILEAPRAFGMMDALIDRPRTTSALAASAVQLLRIRSDAWMELLEDSFELARTSVLALARATAALEERLWARGIPPGMPLPPALDGSGGLDIVQRVAVLMHTPAFHGVGVQPVSDLAAAAEELKFAAGEHLFDRGSGDRVFVIVDGHVEAERKDPRVTWRGGPGQIVCESVCLGALGSSWEARAITEVRALSFGVDDWFDVLQENFEMVRATLATFAQKRERLLAA